MAQSVAPEKRHRAIQKISHLNLTRFQSFWHHCHDLLAATADDLRHVKNAPFNSFPPVGCASVTFQTVPKAWNLPTFEKHFGEIGSVPNSSVSVQLLNVKVIT